MAWLTNGRATAAAKGAAAVLCGLSMLMGAARAQDGASSYTCSPTYHVGIQTPEGGPFGVGRFGLTDETMTVLYRPSVVADNVVTAVASLEVTLSSGYRETYRPLGCDTDLLEGLAEAADSPVERQYAEIQDYFAFCLRLSERASAKSFTTETNDILIRFWGGLGTGAQDLRYTKFLLLGKDASYIRTGTCSLE